MGRLLILLLLGVVVAWWLLGRAARIRGGDTPRTGKTGSPGDAPAAQDMVQCAHCGVHLPRSEALTQGSEPFCSESHRRLGRQP